MATIKIQPGSITKDQVRDILTRSCPDLQVRPLGVHTAVAESNWAGATVMVLKKSVRTSPSIPSMKYLLLGILILLLLGAVIPAVIYGVKVMPRQKEVDRRVVEVLQRELGGAAAPAPARA